MKSALEISRYCCEEAAIVVGLCGGQVGSVLAVYSDDPSSNLVEAYICSEILSLKRMTIKQKRGRGRPTLKKAIDDGLGKL